MAYLCNVQPLGAVVYGEWNRYGLYGEVFLDVEDVKRVRPRDHVAILCAGAIATVISGVEHPDAGMYFGATSDMETISDIMSNFGYDDTEIYNIAMNVLDCLHVFEKELAMIAASLLKNRFVSATEIREIMAAV